MMCKDHDMALETDRKYVSSNDMFGLGDVLREVKTSSGTTYVSPTYHIKEAKEHSPYLR